ncbi:MAG: hypothetical protein CL928_14350 [Deltaproteobacteria bacterium]|nr:hypothetical protein [Deltaproteobacteria bacterium]
MLFGFQRLILLPLAPVGDEPELVALASGLTEDLLRRLNRLGDVRVTIVRDAPDVAPQTETEASPDDTSAEVRHLLERHTSDALIVGTMGLSQEGLRVSLRLVRSGDDGHWTGEEVLAEGAAESVCSGFAFDLVEAAVGSPPDAERLAASGGDRLQAYRDLLLGLAPELDASERRVALERAIAAAPDFLEAQLALVDVLWELGSSQRALQQLKMMTDAERPSPAALQRLAVALRVAGRAEESRAVARQVLSGDPDGPTLFRLGLYAAAGGDHALATEAYEAAVHQGYVDPVLFENLGHELVRMGSDEVAVELWDAALQLDPSLLRLLGERALALFRQGSLDEAKTAFADALECAPEHFATHACRGAWLQAQNAHAEALEAYSMALGLRADDPLVLNSRGVSHHALGDEEGARNDFQAALRHAQDVELLMYIRENLARLDRGALGLNDEAARLLAEGGQLLRHDQAQEAVPRLRSSLERDPTSWTAWLLLALAYRELGEWQEASRSLDEVLTLVPGHAEALSEQSLALLALGRREEALQKGHEAEAQAPDDAGILCNLGVVCMECGWLEEAREVFEEAATLDPADPITARCIDELDQRCRSERPWGAGQWSIP